MNIPTVNPKIEEGWKKALWEEFQQPYFAELKAFLQDEYKSQTVYPPKSQIFNAFDFTPFNEVKVVIIGQDPYHGRGQAHGLCFSVQKGIKPPPSLKNIFKELQSDLSITPPDHGSLENWAHQGVFLLNATLTVRAANAGSHQKKGWERFTDEAIRQLSSQREGLVFLLWGRFAQDKSALIDHQKHLILKAAHPSPFSAHNGFFGCQHFSKVNAYLKENGQAAINWDLS